MRDLNLKLLILDFINVWCDIRVILLEYFRILQERRHV